VAVRLETLRPGDRLCGVDPTGPVEVVQATMAGDGACTLVYRSGSGELRDTILYRGQEATLTVEGPSAQFAFTADAHLFLLASEAQRIRLAHLFEPMQAVFSSTIEPLPHQIRAVYGEMLPRQPLRFLLADDPGAGKTIMAGLLIKELMLRGDVQRCLIVAPGSLVQQWQDELAEKFSLDFDLLSRADVETSRTGNPFVERDRWIARVHQLSRNPDLQARATSEPWDLVIVDEAHRLSAHVWGGEVRRTQLYELGERLGAATRHLLLMTATPHNGKDEDFQLFMALLDADRFAGRPRDGLRSAEAGDLMRRMVKEQLLRFDGTPLFPERVATTVAYPLSPEEAALYEAVTDYVANEMNRAEQAAAEQGGAQRRNRVGFALTVLQRRLASSPEAIYQSLRRRRKRLQERIEELRGSARRRELAREAEWDRLLDSLRDDPDALDDLDGAEVEELEEQLVDEASAARTIAELELEVHTLERLEQLADAVRRSGRDRKWSEFCSLLDAPELHRPDGRRHKLIVFTEHRDTLAYLVDKLRTTLGRPEAVEAISGSTGRDERRRIQERFTQDPDCTVLVATDAAGEGVNLQRAHLLVNYDLPWNPNRIEQRFGRIHRIGQTEVCHMWNLVAADTREGAVFRRLLDKLEEQRAALGGQVFDVLGEALSATALRDLLIDAIRYNNDPEVRARIERVIDARIGDGLRELIDHQALAPDVLDEPVLASVRAQMDEARARRLQPHHIRQFAAAAFRWTGGRMQPRERGRLEIVHVPRELRDQDRRTGRGAPVLARYERVTFDPELVRVPGTPVADLLAPGHPLLDALVSLCNERLGALMLEGTVLVDERDVEDRPWVLVYLEHAISDGRVDAHGVPRVVSRRFEFVELFADGSARVVPAAPYLDYRPVRPDEAEAAGRLLGQPWLADDLKTRALTVAIEEAVPRHLAQVRAITDARIERTRRLVRQRLVSEINHWDAQARDLRLQVEAGKEVRRRPEDADRIATELTERLERRMAELDLEAALQPRPPQVVGAALVVPAALLAGGGEEPGPHQPDPHARRAVERRAVDAVLEIERRLGRDPEEMAPNHPGYDIASHEPDGHVRFIEVKGRTEGVATVSITYTELMTALNSPERHILALVEVGADGTDRVRYVRDLMRDQAEPMLGEVSRTFDWTRLWDRGEEPS
jgi:superfamily II DNA or RNA helicase